ncbi:MAG: protease inhibitor I9 family protein, partial [Clostridia bacterium]|nr:protease inhibitor I9 family protein [Clostridia bacterium]
MKKLLSLLLSIILIFSCAGVTSARQTGAEKKTYIVVLEAPAVYSPDRVTFYGADDDMYRQALIELQAEVRAQISGGASTYSLRNTERTYTYTDVLNGFTVNVDAATADEIKKIDGV